MSDLVVALLLMLGSKDPARAGSAYVRLAERAAPLIQEAVAAEGGDELVLAAVLVRESGLRSHVTGAAGEVGMGQLHPLGMARTVCADLDWARVGARVRRPGGGPLQAVYVPGPDNVRCAARMLAKAATECGPPLRSLGRFNGKRRCGPGRYARRVLELVDRARCYGGTTVAGLTPPPPLVP